jgi:hypothetical protein
MVLIMVVCESRQNICKVYCDGIAKQGLWQLSECIPERYREWQRKQDLRSHHQQVKQHQRSAKYAGKTYSEVHAMHSCHVAKKAEMTAARR